MSEDPSVYLLAPSCGKFSTDAILSKSESSCSGVANGAVFGTDCSLSTLPNKDGPDPLLWKLLGLSSTAD